MDIQGRDMKSDHDRAGTGDLGPSPASWPSLHHTPEELVTVRQAIHIKEGMAKSREVLKRSCLGAGTLSRDGGLTLGHSPCTFRVRPHTWTPCTQNEA